MALSFSRPDPSSPDAVAGATFSTGRRGFDQNEVHDFLRMVAAELARLQERERYLERELRTAQRGAPNPAVVLDEEVVTRMLGEEASRILATSREAASQIKVRAEEAAARIVGDAADEAQRVREEVHVEAARRRQDAAADAESEVEMAKQQGREMVNEARAYRERVLTELSRRRELARQQIEQLVHGRDRLVQAFERARLAAVDVMSELTPLGEPSEYVNLSPTTGPVPVMLPNQPRPTPQPEPEPPRMSFGDDDVPDISPDDLVGDVAAEEVADDVAVEQAVGDIAVEQGAAALAVEEGADLKVEEAVGDVAVEEAVGDVAVEEAVGDVAVEEAVGDVAVEEAVGDVAVEEGADLAVEEAAGVVAVEEAAGVVVVEETADVVAVEETAARDASPEDAATEVQPEVAEVEPEGEAAPRVVSLFAGEVIVDHPTTERGARATAGTDAAGADAAPGRRAVTTERDGPTPGAQPATAVADGTDQAGDAPTASDERVDVDAAGVDDLFARLRAVWAESIAERARLRADDVAPPPAPAPAVDDDATRTLPRPDRFSVFEPSPVEPTADAGVDDSPFGRRDSALTPLIVTAARKLKRVLADEQNDVLHALRRSPSVTALEPMLPSAAEHARRYGDVIAAELVDAAVAGAGSLNDGSTAELQRRVRTADATAPAVEALTTTIVAPLRDRMAHAVDDAAGDTTELAALARAVYREWKVQHIDERLDEVVRIAFGRGALAGVDPGTPVKWTHDPRMPVCADCDDNALTGVIGAGEPFATGQSCAPAHEGCRCMLATDGG